MAVDPIEFRRDAALSLGAHVAAASVEEAAQLLAELTRGVMADKVIVCVGVLYGHLVGPISELVSKGGRLVITSVTPMHETSVTIALGMFAMSNKSLLGHVFGQVNPAADFPRLLALYRSGALQLDELITRRYPLAQINEGYADMHAGRTVRGLVEHG
jgi:S-(hydroxymethyl)glutathione dehydrogenase/alcohol dehydrogenase